jgi:hypothetical protein
MLTSSSELDEKQRCTERELYSDFYYAKFMLISIGLETLDVLILQGNMQQVAST